jgi:hypothetical protein
MVHRAGIPNSELASHPARRVCAGSKISQARTMLELKISCSDPCSDPATVRGWRKSQSHRRAQRRRSRSLCDALLPFADSFSELSTIRNRRPAIEQVSS